MRASADAVLLGAADLLATHRPRSILVMLKDTSQAAAVRAAAERVGYQASAFDAEGGGSELVLRLSPAAEGARQHPWSALKRAAGRVRLRD